MPTDSAIPREALVVDDDPGNRDVLRVLLEQLGYQVRSAPDGRSGIALAARAFALAFVDLRLPDLPGTEVVAAVRRAGPETFIAVATMDDTAQTMLAAFAAGCDTFLVKPYDIDQVMSLVRNARRGRRWIADHMGLREYKGR